MTDAWFFELPARAMTILAFLLGLILIDDLNADQQNSLGNFLMLIGQVLETNCTQQQNLQTPLYENDRSNLSAELSRLEARFIELEKRLNETGDGRNKAL